MARASRLSSDAVLQYVVFLSLSVAVLVMTGVAHSLDNSSFQRFFGRVHPLLFVSVVCLVGLVLFFLLLSDGRFAIYRRADAIHWLLAVGLAVPFGAAMILVDSKAPFPADINVGFPASVLFYPVMGYVAEILFQILPFCLVYLALATVRLTGIDRIAVWVGILAAASVEPIFQVVFGAGSNPVWVQAYVGLHVFAICLVQLLLFRRYDFLTMYGFRLSYYLIWHILWGYLRLGLLF